MLADALHERADAMQACGELPLSAFTRTMSARRPWSRRWIRTNRLAGLSAVIAAAFLVSAAGAEAAPGHATVFTHSATSGEFRGGRLVLHGVRGRMSYVTNAGRTGVVSVRRAHRWLFVPRMGATGTLHVAGLRGGEEPTFRLSRPRYNASRRTVSYRAKPLNKKRVPGRAAGVARRFGAASLSILPAPRLMGGQGGGPSCGAELDGATGTVKSSSIGAHNHWDESLSGTQQVEQRNYLGNSPWGTYADAGYGCSNTVTFNAIDDDGDSATITVTVTWEPGQQPSYSCTPSSIDVSCNFGVADTAGHAVFLVD
jgi:hypothetical protein